MGFGPPIGSPGLGGGPGSDSTAIHVDQANEYTNAALGQKVAPVNADRVLVEDSANAFQKVWVDLSLLLGGGGGNDPTFNTIGLDVANDDLALRRVVLNSLVNLTLDDNAAGSDFDLKLGNSGSGNDLVLQARTFSGVSAQLNLRSGATGVSQLWAALNAGQLALHTDGQTNDMAFVATGIRIRGGRVLTWNDGFAASPLVNVDTGLERDSAGRVNVTNGSTTLADLGLDKVIFDGGTEDVSLLASTTTLQVRDAGDTADASVTCLDLTASGVVTGLSNQIVTTAGFTTTSLTDVLITGLTITPAAGTYMVWLNGTAQHQTNNEEQFMSIYSGGVQATNTEAEISDDTERHGFATMAIVTVNGAEAIEARLRTTAGTAEVFQTRLSILRVT